MQESGYRSMTDVKDKRRWWR